MAYYKVRVRRCCNSPKTFIVQADRNQSAVCAAAKQLREEGVSDARAIEVIGQVQSLRG